MKKARVECLIDQKTASSKRNTPESGSKCSEFSFRICLEFTDGEITNAIQSLSPCKISGSLEQQLKMEVLQNSSKPLPRELVKQVYEQMFLSLPV